MPSVVDVQPGASSPALSRKRRPRATSSSRGTRGSTSRKEISSRIPVARTEESKVLDDKVKGDYYKYLAECATGDAESKKFHPGKIWETAEAYLGTKVNEAVSKTAENARVAYAEDTKTVEQPLQFIDKVVDFPVVTQQTPTVQMSQKMLEIPQLHHMIDGPVVLVVSVPQVQVAEQTVEMPQLNLSTRWHRRNLCVHHAPEWSTWRRNSRMTARYCFTSTGRALTSQVLCTLARMVLMMVLISVTREMRRRTPHR